MGNRRREGREKKGRARGDAVGVERRMRGWSRRRDGWKQRRKKEECASRGCRKATAIDLFRPPCRLRLVESAVVMEKKQARPCCSGTER